MFFKINEPGMGPFHGKIVKVWVKEEVYHHDYDTQYVEDELDYSRYLVGLPYDEKLYRELSISKMHEGWEELDFYEERTYVSSNFPGWKTNQWCTYLSDDQGEEIFSVTTNEEALGVLYHDWTYLEGE